MDVPEGERMADEPAAASPVNLADEKEDDEKEDDEVVALESDPEFSGNVDSVGNCGRNQCYFGKRGIEGGARP